MVESRLNFRNNGNSLTRKSELYQINEKKTEKLIARGQNSNLLQSHVDTRISLPLEQQREVHDRFDESQIGTEQQYVSLNDDQLIEFELPTLNEPKHGKSLFETIK